MPLTPIVSLRLVRQCLSQSVGLATYVIYPRSIDKEVHAVGHHLVVMYLPYDDVSFGYHVS